MLRRIGFLAVALAFVSACSRVDEGCKTRAGDGICVERAGNGVESASG